MPREMKESGVDWIGEIPTSWTTSKLKYIGTYINGYLFKSSMFSKSGKRVLRLQDLSKSYHNPQYFSGTVDTKFMASKGDILVSWNATLDAFVWDGEDAYFKHHILKAIPTEEKVSKQFFYWLLKLAMKNMSGDGIVMTHIRLGDFSDFTVPMPPLSEQIRIEEYLTNKCSEIDTLIAQTKSTIEEYKALMLSLISDAVVKGIRADRTYKDSGYELIGQIPSDWSVSKIKNLYEALNGIQLEAERYGVGYPFLNYSDINRFVLPDTVNGLADTTEAERKRYTVKSGDIFFTRTTEGLDNVGVPSVCLSDIENATYSSFLVRVRPFTDSVLPCYAKYYFRSSPIRQYIISKVNRGTSVNLTQEVLKAMPILIPSKEEQIEIATYLDEKCLHIESLIEKKMTLIAELETYKNSVIFEVLTGKKEVKDER
jgi:type I restriction enzyme S subunit